MTVGERIRQLRIKNAYNQVDLAAKINVSKQTLYKYEHGIINNIPADKIERIAEALYTTPSYLMGWDETIDNSKTSLSDKVKKRRLELGLTQEELAKRMGYSSRVSINKIENGRQVSQKIIIRLAKALNVPVTYLMDLDESSDFVFRDMNDKDAFRAYLKSLNWDVSLSGSEDEFIGEDENGNLMYTQSLSNGNVSFKMSADEFERMMDHSKNDLNQYILNLINKKSK